MSTFTATANTGGAFDCDGADYAIGRSSVTTAAPTSQVSYKFNITRRPLVLRVGSSAGAQDIVNDREFVPGDYVYSFVPTVSPYYVEFQLREEGLAVLSGFARIAPGQLTLPTPWAEEDLRGLRSEQSLDVQWWSHVDYQTRVLERLAANSWGLRLYQPRNGPFEPEDASGFTLTPNARTGVANVNASGPVFKTTDVGSLLRLTQTGQFETFSANAVDEQTDPIRVTGSGAARTFYYTISGTFVGTLVLERSVDGGVSYAIVATHTSTVTNQQIADGLDGQIAYYRLRMTAYTSGAAVLELLYAGGVTNGVGRIFSVNADNAVTVDVLEPFAALTATSVWARGSWSDRYGWPAAPALYDGRLGFIRKDKRWQSESDDYESFLVGPDDANAISGSIPGKMNVARWLKAGDKLWFGSSGAEGVIGTGGFDEVGTPENVRARVRTERGSANGDAILADGYPVFIHRSGRKLHMIAESGNAWDIFNITRLHSRIAGGVNGQFLELGWQLEPEPRVWAVRDDGQAAIQLLSKEAKVGPLVRYVPQGTAAKIESLCIVPGTPEDATYLSVIRTVDGASLRTIEKVARENWAVSSEAIRLQAAVTYSGEMTDEISGLDHLEGQTVYAWADGRISGPHTVTGGEITLSYEASFAVVGLKYQGKYKGPRAGGMVANWGKIESINLLLSDAVGGSVSWGTSFDRMDTLPDRQSADATYDSPLPVFNDDIGRPMVGGWERDQRVHIRFNGVGPSGILGYVPKVQKNG